MPRAGHPTLVCISPPSRSSSMLFRCSCVPPATSLKSNCSTVGGGELGRRLHRVLIWTPCLPVMAWKISNNWEFHASDDVISDARGETAKRLAGIRDHSRKFMICICVNCDSPDLASQCYAIYSLPIAFSSLICHHKLGRPFNKCAHFTICHWGCGVY